MRRASSAVFGALLIGLLLRDLWRHAVDLSVDGGTHRLLLLPLAPADRALRGEVDRLARSS